MSIPYYVNENKSDMRGIKSGWYAMDDGGKFSSGPFLNRDDCLSKGTQPTKRLNTRGSYTTAEVKQVPLYIDRR